ncbi:MAG: ABC transporter ATP-binding protein [Candidatus Thermoplasmatota archaeon]|jgi:multiple sugar transport system ATP-binding protein|nr:ABC transporter ATP-binding protein [Candidatus Thermoplasmatota archaeon]MCL5785121.1 ABC transporter ATP-binding protein [Candidatus Thermoplasmatota archaeon]
MGFVSLQNISKTFGNKFNALDNVSLEVDKGEFFVLLGPSGSGKTTLIRCIAGLETVDDGRISIGDRVITDFPAGERNVAMVFQNYALYPFLTVYDNLAFPLKARGRLKRTLWAESLANGTSPTTGFGYSLGLNPIKRSEVKRHIRERIDRVAEMLQITDILERKPGQISGGQRQRVALGRALIREANVYLMDEPLSNLDAKLRSSTRVELKNLQKKLGITVIYVTHDQIEAMTMGDRIGVINKGHLIQIGKPLDVYNMPDNLFVASFLGDPPINQVDGKVSEKDKSKITFGGFDLKLPGKPDLSGVSGKTLKLAIRPEDVELGDHGASARVLFVRSIGRTHYISVVLQETEEMITKVTTEETGVTEGTDVLVMPNLSHLDVFEKDSEELVWSAKRNH